MKVCQPADLSANSDPEFNFKEFLKIVLVFLKSIAPLNLLLLNAD